MQISERGLQLIKKYEGCRLQAYKPVAEEEYYTIGYGHYGADVRKDQTITQAEAENLLKNDLKKYESEVQNCMFLTFKPNQNQFDALVSFHYNTGAINTLAKHGSIEEMAKYMLKYVYGANGKKLLGLVRRRQEEHDLFLSALQFQNVSRETNSNPYISDLQYELNAQNFRDKNENKLIVDGIGGELTLSACPTVKKGARGNITRWIQARLCVSIDGIFGNETERATILFQQRNGLLADGIIGINTWRKLIQYVQGWC